MASGAGAICQLAHNVMVWYGMFKPSKKDVQCADSNQSLGMTYEHQAYRRLVGSWLEGCDAGGS
jgi:hypothetical protein